MNRLVIPGVALIGFLLGGPSTASNGLHIDWAGNTYAWGDVDAVPHSRSSIRMDSGSGRYQSVTARSSIPRGPLWSLRKVDLQQARRMSMSGCENLFQSLWRVIRVLTVRRQFHLVLLLAQWSSPPRLTRPFDRIESPPPGL